MICLAGLLHDIGKLAVPPQILCKPVPLSVMERRLAREHCQRGYEMLTSISSFDATASSVLHHHERYVGGGYPDGLDRKRIPLGARIIAVADAFDAMTHPRPYASPRTVERALKEIKRCTRTQFDPEMVDAFLGSLTSKSIQTTCQA